MQHLINLQVQGLRDSLSAAGISTRDLVTGEQELRDRLAAAMRSEQEQALRERVKFRPGMRNAKSPVFVEPTFGGVAIGEQFSVGWVAGADANGFGALNIQRFGFPLDLAGEPTAPVALGRDGEVGVDLDAPFMLSPQARAPDAAGRGQDTARQGRR